MSHTHFCGVADHWWECNGKALRRGDTEPSVCRCDTCGLPLEGGDHSQCEYWIELVACPEHPAGAARKTEAEGTAAGRAAAAEAAEASKPAAPDSIASRMEREAAPRRAALEKMFPGIGKRIVRFRR